MHVSLSCLEMKAKSPSLGVRWNGPIYTKLWAKKSWQVQAAMSTCSTFWDYVGANWMGKCTSSSLRKGHRIKCQCSTGKDNPWALSTQFNLNPGQTVKSRDTVCSHSRVYGQNICRFSFFLILKGFRNVLKQRLLPGTHPHPCANCHSSDSMKQLEAGTSCFGWQSEAHSQSHWGRHRDRSVRLLALIPGVHEAEWILVLCQLSPFSLLSFLGLQPIGECHPHTGRVFLPLLILSGNTL